MSEADRPKPHPDPRREARASQLLSDVLVRAGWEVANEPWHSSVTGSTDLSARRGGFAYAVEVKVASEGRADRLVPLWAQACLEASQAAGPDQRPMAVVIAPRIAPRAAEQVLRFAERVTPDAGCGVIDHAGLQRFRGPGLVGLDADPVRGRQNLPAAAGHSGKLFSDLNQWMLKVLIAPEVPAALLTAPRLRPRNAAELARVADVSHMSAHRLVRQLEQEGYLHESRPFLSLVRRAELFGRWNAAVAHGVQELPMRFLFQGDAGRELRHLLGSHQSSLGLFAAAELLGAGHVRGLPPHVYMAKESLGVADPAGPSPLLPARPGEVPDLIIRVPSAPQSVFRGRVAVDGLPCCDIVQIWLDVSAHPARGAEQAEIIERRILGPVIAGNDDD